MIRKSRGLTNKGLCLAQIAAYIFLILPTNVLTYINEVRPIQNKMNRRINWQIFRILDPVRTRHGSTSQEL